MKSLFKASQPLAACIALSTWLEPGLNWEVIPQPEHMASCSLCDKVHPDGEPHMGSKSHFREGAHDKSVRASVQSIAGWSEVL